MKFVLVRLITAAAIILSISAADGDADYQDLTVDQILGRINRGHTTTTTPPMTSEYVDPYLKLGFQWPEEDTIPPRPTTPATEPTTTTAPPPAYTEFKDKLTPAEQEAIEKYMSEMDVQPEQLLHEGVSVGLYQTMWGLDEEEAQHTFEEEYTQDFNVFYDSYSTDDYERLLVLVSENIKPSLNLSERVTAVLEPVETNFCRHVNEMYDSEDVLACSFVEKGLSLLMAFDAATTGINKTAEKVVECLRDFKEDAKMADPVDFDTADNHVGYQAAKPSLLYSAAYDPAVSSNHTRIGPYLEEAMQVALTNPGITTERLRHASLILAQMFDNNDWMRLEKIHPTFNDVLDLAQPGHTVNFYNPAALSRKKRAAWWRRGKSRSSSVRMMKAMARLNKAVRGQGWFRSLRRTERAHYITLVKYINFFRNPDHWANMGKKKPAKLVIKNPAQIKWRAAGEMAARAYKLETHARGKLRSRRALTMEDEMTLKKFEEPPVFKKPTQSFSEDAYKPGKHILFVCYLMALLCDSSNEIIL